MNAKHCASSEKTIVSRTDIPALKKDDILVGERDFLLKTEQMNKVFTNRIMKDMCKVLR